MSCDYANGLSSYDNKGVLGVPEVSSLHHLRSYFCNFRSIYSLICLFRVIILKYSKKVFDDEKTVDEKCAQLAQMILASKHVVVHTGAGISTSAGIPDFRCVGLVRFGTFFYSHVLLSNLFPEHSMLINKLCFLYYSGPKGVWTLEKEGKAPQVNVSFSEAIPTKCHMALKALVQSGHIKYIISQNIDGLHLRSGVKRKHLAELHGNMFVENCDKCRRQYVRATPTPTVGQKRTGGICKGGKGARACRGGYLLDNILDWEHDLPDKDLDMAINHAW